jgi:NAD(P)-dependent dehydrogenase (short-subunit alcohol dehydrogenase family)
MFATQVLAPFALTSWLTELLARRAPSRVINVSSGGMYGQSLPSGDLQSDRLVGGTPEALPTGTWPGSSITAAPR